MEKIVLENAFDEKKKRPGLKFNPGLALIGLRTELITDSLRYFVLVDFMDWCTIIWCTCVVTINCNARI